MHKRRIRTLQALVNGIPPLFANANVARIRSEFGEAYAVRRIRRADRRRILEVLRNEPGLELDYLALTGPGLEELPDYPETPVAGRVLVAARVGATRLIDNLPITIANNNGASTTGGDSTTTKGDS